MISPSIVWLTLTIFGVVAAIAIIVDVRRKKWHGRTRGVKPGKGGSLVTGSMGTGKGDAVSVAVISKDPQSYSQIYVPSKDRK